ncbi:BppU family phage baseplate upper protein [Bacillus mycoides]|uniref:BppU family phage baseplate upper protein n=1 Tax=Bacillus mycoides TaxID=1405 RepID=UPI00292D4EC7|nr:BppU family phage baseplate upper protein [Bacillus mycoides]WOA56397.1 BppU family phage baseplate upper protein [Bacillus mycoides]
MKTKLILDINKTQHAQLNSIVTGRVGDKASNVVDVYVMDNVSPYNLTGLDVFFECTKPDNTAIRDGNNVRIIDATSGRFEYTFPPETFGFPGKAKQSFFSIEKNGITRSSTQDFTLVTLPDAITGRVPSDSYFSELEDIIKDATDIVERASGSPKGVFATLADLKAKFPKGDYGIYIVSTDGKWYYWNNNAWTAGGVYQSTGIANNAAVREKIPQKTITEEKTSFFNAVSNNLVNKDTLRPGGYFAENGVWINNALFASTDYIPVTEGVTYISKVDKTVTFWDVNFSFVEGRINGGGKTITVPTGKGILYARFIFDVSDTTPQVNKGTTLLTYDTYAVSHKNLKLNSNNIDSPAVLPNIVLTPTENLFDKTKVIFGYYDNTGAFINDSVWMISDFIEVIAGESYTQLSSGYRSCWDANKQFVQTIQGNPPFVIPTGKNIKFIRIITQVGRLDTEMFVKGNVYPSQYIPFRKFSFDPNVYNLNPAGKKSKIDGLTWNAYGDSITDNFRSDNYVALISRSHGVIPRNYGLSGRTIASRPSQDAQYPPAVTDYVNMNNNADVITIFCGTNDYGNQLTLGTINSTVKTEFYGALNILALGLIEKYPGKKIAFITPMQRRGPSLAVPLSTYVNAVKEIGTKYGIPVLDLYNNCGLYPDSDLINNTFFSNKDGLHPNPEGYKVFSPRIATFLESL